MTELRLIKMLTAIFCDLSFVCLIQERNAPDGGTAADTIGATTLAFGKPVLRSFCNHCADAIANNRIFEHRSSS